MKITLQKQSPVIIVERRNEDGVVTWLLKYYLKTYPNLDDDGSGRFGIKVTRTKLDGTLEKEAETFAITDNYDEAMAMIGHFSKGAVCHYTLNDMVEEWLAEKALMNGNALCYWALQDLYTYHEW